MAQADTSGMCVGGNTISPTPRGRNRTYCFTLNNYEQKDINKIESLGGTYVFQEEKGAEGTPHLQGVIWWKNPRSFTAVKKMIPRAHWESCRDKIGSIKYCSEQAKRFGKLYSNYRELDKYRHNGTGKKSKKNFEHTKEFLEWKKEQVEMLAMASVKSAREKGLVLDSGILSEMGRLENKEEKS